MMDERNLPQTVRQSLNALDHSAKLELLEQHKKENKKPLWKRISFGAKPKDMDSSRSSTVETNYTRISESSLNEEARIEKQFNHYLNNSNLSDETRAIMSKYDLQQKKLYVDRFQNNDIDKAFSAVLIAMQMNETERMNLSKQSKEEKIAIIQRYNELTKNKGRYRNKPLPTPVEEQYPNNNKPAISSSNSDSKISGNSLGTVLNPPPYKTELPRLHHSLSGSNPSNPASTLSRSTFESSRPPKSTISMSSSKSSFRGENRERILKNYQKDNAKIENKRSKEALEPRRSLNSYSSFQNIPKEPLVLFPELRKRAGSIGTESLSNPQSNLPYHGTPRIDHSSFPENSPEWFIVNLANRLKLAMKNDNFLVDFVNSIVSYSGSIGVNGISTLEISLDRVCTPFYQSETLKRRLYESKGTKGGKPDTDKPLPFIPGPLSWYADSVLPDELRLEVIRCVELIMKNDVGMTAILSSGGLIRQILWCYALPKPLIQEQMLKDRRLTSAYIELLSTISGIIGPACIVDDNLKNIVIQVVHELQKYQNESMPFYFLVNSLRNPIFPSDKSTTKRYSLANVTMLLDLSTIWYFRTQTMVFFNGFVSSSDSIFERSKLRKMLEACGLYKIIQDLLSRSPSEEFLVQAKSYLQDRENDLKVQERTFKTKTEMMGDSRAIVESLFQAIGTFPDPSMAAHFLTLTLQNLANIFSKVKEKNGNQTIADLQQRENTAKIFRLVENSTRSLYSSIENLQIDQMNSVGLSANLESEFLLAIENELGISLRPSEKINQNSSEELLQLREKVYELQRRNNALLRKINEPGNMSRSYRLESAFDTPEQILEKERRKKLELNLPSDSFGTNFFDSMPSDLMSDGAIPVDRKHARSRIAKTAGIGRLWEEIQRLETLVEILQDKKRADLEEKKEEEAAVPVIPNIPPPPPPPVPPAPPPPPPPPLAMPVPGIKLKAKEVLKPARKPLKPFQWAKIPNHMLHDTIWKKLYEEANDLVILNEDDIYELFTKKEVEVKKIQSEKKTVVRILDRKISQNIEIVLNGFKLPFETIRGAIFTLNDDILNLERLCNLAPSIPEVEVIETIKAYNGSTKELGIAEQFILSVADIPNLSKRLTSMIFRLKFQQEYDEVYPDIQTIITAIGQVKDSKAFYTLLQVVLVIGNFMNASTFRGNAKGFKLDSLLLLKDTKAEANNRFNCPTLLHYIVRILEQQFPGTVDFIAEMDQVVYAGRMNIPNLLGCVKDLEEGLLHLEKEMDEWIEIITHPSDLFISTFQVFIVSAKDKLEDIKREMGILETRMQSLFEMYGEEESDRKDAPQTFFETIQKFSQMLKKAQMENDLIDKRIAKRLANEQKKKMEEQRKAIDNEIINEHNFADIKGVQEPEDQNTHTMELTTFLMKGVSMAEARNTIKRVKTSTRTNNLRIVDSLQIADTNTLSTSLNQFATIEEETEEDLQAKSLEDLETRSIEFGSSSSVEEL
ncbi:hypothetical protein HK103_001540 [Boothiomyces macroporosus]|uniref:Uncharacterized protein n=1 Tax=Boothiomyces macroporosus TaxID=261099 RepID=A0AAD5Y0V1_9FUNG|nr:hypothetical protein HK103_001540 [Boothiomyces macroporosus]